MQFDVSRDVEWQCCSSARSASRLDSSFLVLPGLHFFALLVQD